MWGGSVTDNTDQFVKNKQNQNKQKVIIKKKQTQNHLLQEIKHARFLSLTGCN